MRGSNNVTLTAGNGQISQNGSGVITGGLLTTNSATGTLLNGATNAVTGFNATNSTSGNISLTDNTGTLAITGITDNNATGSAVSITNSNVAGNIGITGALNAGSNNVTLTAGNGQISREWQWRDYGWIADHRILNRHVAEWSHKCSNGFQWQQ